MFAKRETGREETWARRGTWRNRTRVETRERFQCLCLQAGRQAGGHGLARPSEIGRIAEI